MTISKNFQLRKYNIRDWARPEKFKVDRAYSHNHERPNERQRNTLQFNKCEETDLYLVVKIKI